ncbi:HlyD family secretion protein [Sphingobium yanoikuyae]|uniref:HlyD family secretion protein n=1 Tax=Sphingobium yanoikuyae TaxID=13690 RepID=UPI0028DB910F|nr:HlyD family efflux transporter periplasmic adaptor subunit [Sphingobium yanoikuyae]
MEFFRQEAVRRQQDRLHGTVFFENNLRWITILLYLSIAFVAIVVILGVSTYPLTASATGILRLQAGKIKIVPDRNGVVERLFVKNGDYIVAGQALVVIKAQDTGHSGTSLGSITRAAIQEEVQGIDTQSHSATNLHNTEMRGLKMKIADLESEIASYNDREEAMEHLLDVAEQDFELAKKVAERGYLSIQDLRRRELAVYARKESLASLRAELRSKASQITEISTEIESANIRHAIALSHLQVRRAELTRGTAENEIRRGEIVRATSGGAVANLDIGIGHYVVAGQALATITPLEQTLRAELEFDDRLAALVKNGQAVRIALASFPPTRYGYLAGKISGVSHVPKIQGEGDGTRYRAFAALELKKEQSSAVKIHLIDGMPVKAYILLEKPSLFTRFVNPRLWFSTL